MGLRLTPFITSWLLTCSRRTVHLDTQLNWTGIVTNITHKTQLACYYVLVTGSQHIPLSASSVAANASYRHLCTKQPPRPVTAPNSVAVTVRGTANPPPEFSATPVLRQRLEEIAYTGDFHVTFGPTKVFTTSLNCGIWVTSTSGNNSNSYTQDSRQPDENSHCY